MQNYFEYGFAIFPTNQEILVRQMIKKRLVNRRIGDLTIDNEIYFNALLFHVSESL